MKIVTLKKNEEFLRAYRSGAFYVGKYLVLYIYRNIDKGIRLGISVNKKVGKSVVRNRVRRLIKENFRNISNLLDDNVDYVFMVRKFDFIPTYYEIRREMVYLTKKMGLLNENTEEIRKFE